MSKRLTYLFTAILLLSITLVNSASIFAQGKNTRMSKTVDLTKARELCRALGLYEQMAESAKEIKNNMKSSDSTLTDERINKAATDFQLESKMVDVVASALAKLLTSKDIDALIVAKNTGQTPPKDLLPKLSKMDKYQKQMEDEGKRIGLAFAMFLMNKK